MKIALIQMNAQIGNFEQNQEKILNLSLEARRQGAHLAVFPELALCGYPPMDLLDKPVFWQRAKTAAEELAKQLPPDLGVIFGNVRQGKYNSAFFCLQGEVRYQDKTLLPTYDVFDESRYFTPASEWRVFEFQNRRIFLTVCEDIWDGYGFNPHDRVENFDLVINISASPFETGKMEKRLALMKDLCLEKKVWGVYVNTVGANDELIFDGRSFALTPDGKGAVFCKAFQEDFQILDTERVSDHLFFTGENAPEAIYEALILGIKDYFAKTGFKKAVLGLSGGVDSALVAALAARALGPENVTGLLMPGPFSSDHSITDALALARNLGIQTHTLPIGEPYEALLKTLNPIFEGQPFNLTEENLQARIRGNLVMAYSNKFGALALNTGNKSELAVGYCTLYGDMAGALAVIGDVYKTEVYQVCNFINGKKEVIPAHILSKAPSAELRPNQTDQDSLPPYEELDRILSLYIEDNRSAEEIALETGYALEKIKDIRHKVLTSEYKRRQAPLVLKVSRKAFGSGRRIPVTSRFG